MTWRSVPLEELLTTARPGFASGDHVEGGVFQVRMNNVNVDGNWDLSRRRRVAPPNRDAGTLGLRPGDVLFNATNSPDLVGKSALVPDFGEPAFYSNHFLRLRTDPARLEPAYLAHWLRHQYYRGTFQGLSKQWVNQATVGRDRLLGLQIASPPVPEQRRIADILDRADATKAKRQQSIRVLDMLGQAVYDEMFGRDQASPNAVSSSPLSELALVSSGITLGRRTTEPTVSVPYVTVANVQDRRLDLQKVKTIGATPAEIERYRLASGDLLLTEGGDPDKLGRGTLWRSEIETCIHQNHVFRVRVTRADLIDPLYLNWHVGSRRGKSYFFRSAKQTTGIASINSTQLKAFPVLLPPLGEQQRFADRIAAIDSLAERSQAHLGQLDHAIAALRHRAFRGEL